MKRLSREKPLFIRLPLPSLVRRGAALAALCALALTACGTERAGGNRDPKAGQDDRVEAGSPAASRPAETRRGSEEDEDEYGSPEFFAYMELLTSLAKPCLPDIPLPPLETDPDAEEPQTTPLPLPSLPEKPPSEETRDPGAARQEVALSSVEKCDARIHARRITKALEDTTDPTPRQVGEVLRGLGYIEERIHGPRRSGESVEFTLDLRLLGGQLCLSGRVTGTDTGTRTVFDPYGASPEVSCLEVRRHR